MCVRSSQGLSAQRRMRRYGLQHLRESAARLSAWVCLKLNCQLGVRGYPRVWQRTGPSAASRKMGNSREGMYTGRRSEVVVEVVELEGSLSAAVDASELWTLAVAGVVLFDTAHKRPSHIRSDGGVGDASQERIYGNSSAGIRCYKPISRGFIQKQRKGESSTAEVEGELVVVVEDERSLRGSCGKRRSLHAAWAH